MVDPILEGMRAADEPIWAVYPRRRHLQEALQHEPAAAMNQPG